MISFECDYLEGCHENILKAFLNSNLEQLPGYGADKYCVEAKEKIKDACKSNKLDIYFLHGGTQTNQIAIDSLLSSVEGVIAADTGHVSVHEAGAIEFTGHKVLTLKSNDGKISALGIDKYLNDFNSDLNHEHMVQPGMVYISQPTEYGTLYSKTELSDIYKICIKHGIKLYIDGARLAYALGSLKNDVQLSDLPNLCDAFYIGGTKCGALCGEALIFCNKTPKNFVTIIKQHGALGAKGRLYGIQFNELFKNNLYENLGKEANQIASKVANTLVEFGIKPYLLSPTNQQFFVMTKDMQSKLSKYVRFSFWEHFDENSDVVRFATSFATKNDAVDELKNVLDKVSNE